MTTGDQVLTANPTDMDGSDAAGWSVGASPRRSTYSI
jgi:hypothetical protein